MLHLPYKPVPARFCNVIITFALSGVMHSCAGIAAGMLPKQLNMVQFLITQALGVVVGDLIWLVFSKIKGEKNREKTEPPSLMRKIIGYIWVAAFMTGSGSVWLHPQASRSTSPGTNDNFLPSAL